MMRRWVFFLIIFLLPALVFATKVQASLDRNQIHLGETVTLNLRVEGATSIDNPDLTALSKDFDVLGMPSTSSSYTFVNGHASSQMIIGVALRPKHVGEIQVPSLTVAGASTQPSTLHVLPPDTAGGSNNGKDVFLETSVSPEQAYVGEQLLYTVRLFFDVNLSDGSLPDPQVADADVRRLGTDANFDTERGGKHYHVIERHYAITPQQAGTLTIAPLDFQGTAINAGNPQDPNNFPDQSGLFGTAVPISAQSQQVTVAVRAPPSDWGKTTWLPARELTLTLDGMPADNATLTVGQPLNLHMTIHAVGLPAETLPEPSLPALDGAAVYPDKSVDNTTDDGEWVSSQRARNITIIPSRAGTLTVPQTTLTWFNVQSGQKQVATIPAHSFTVSAAAGTSPAAASSTMPPAASTSSAVGAADSSAPIVAGPSWWRWVALASLAIWLITIALFIAWYRRRNVPPEASALTPTTSSNTGAMRRDFLAVARGTDRATQAHALLQWARSERPALQNLSQLAAALGSPTQRAAIDALQRLQFADVASNSTIDLHGTFANGFEWRRDDPSNVDSPLPPLYPFKLD